MRGTTSALRVILGNGLGSDHDGEFVTTATGDRFHVFDAFALVNVLLCSAGPKTTSEGKSTPTMRRNCLRHFAATLRILEPTLVILQGVGVARWTKELFHPRTTLAGGHLMESHFDDRRVLVCSFSHPAAHGQLRWGDRLDGGYLRETVEPTLRLAVSSL